MKGKNLKEKIILGTVQLGMNYGFCQNNLYKSKKNIFKILNYAKNNKIKYLDTAEVYGRAEKNIGEFHSSHKINEQFKIVTKLNNLSKIKKKNLNMKVFDSIRNSLFYLKKTRIDILLIHNYKDLIKHKVSLIKYLKKLQIIGLINEIGVSVYSPREAERCMNIKFVKHIQIPFNLLDQRWLKESFRKKLKFRPDIKIHARSIFLQGLLLNKQKNWPKWFKNKNKAVQNIDLISRKFKKKNKADLCLSYVKSFNWIDFIIIGINSLKQLKNIIHMNRNKSLNLKQRSFVISEMRKIANNRILLPYKWDHKI